MRPLGAAFVRSAITMKSSSMDAIEHLVDLFEFHRISRRESVASLATILAGATATPALTQGARAPTQVAQGRTLNHASLAVTDVAAAADFYSKVLGREIVSRPGNGGLNLGLGDGFLGLYKPRNPGSANHIWIGVDDYEPQRIAASLKSIGVEARVDTNPANRTSGGDQLYVRGPDNFLIQLSANGYRG